MRGSWCPKWEGLLTKQYVDIGIYSSPSTRMILTDPFHPVWQWIPTHILYRMAHASELGQTKSLSPLKTLVDNITSLILG